MGAQCREAAEHFAEVLRINPRDNQARHLLAAHQGQTTSTAPAAYVSTLFDGFADTFDEKLVGELGYRTPEVLYDYAHASSYIRGLAAQTGFREIECQAAVLRKDKGHDINGCLFLLQRPTDLL